VHTEHVGDAVRDICPRRQGREVDEPHAIDEAPDTGGRDSERETSLATAALAEQGHQPMLVEQRRHGGGFRDPSHERCQRSRQVVGDGTLRPQRTGNSLWRSG
jgi:hypothetical protein